MERAVSRRAGFAFLDRVAGLEVESDEVRPETSARRQSSDPSRSRLDVRMSRVDSTSHEDDAADIDVADACSGGALEDRRLDVTRRVDLGHADGGRLDVARPRCAG